MTVMSHAITYSTADKTDVLADLGSNGDLTADRQRRLDGMRKDARAHQDDLDRQGVDRRLSLPDALDHLIAGRTDSDAECAGNAYHSALQHIIDHNASDPAQLGKPSTSFGLVDDAMRSLGVPADLLPHGYLFGLAQLQSVVDDSSVKPLPEPVEHRLFPSQDRAVHRRRGWAACLSMASDRIAHYEWGNGENLRGFHTGAGWLSWWGDDYANEQYSETFWATVDPYRLPGITASQKRLADGQGGQWGAERPAVKWVGGTTDGTYAAVGQHLKGIASTLVARKSWFFLDEGIVCLGAGVTASDGEAVNTVIDNRRLGATGTHALTVDGRRRPGTPGWSETLTDPGWAHIAGHGGYVFPAGGRVTALREERTGRWSDIRTGSSTAPCTDRYLTLYVDHGTDPVDGTYAYVMLPGASAARTAARAAGARGLLRTLANSPRAQGVRVPSLGFTAVNFWAAGTVGDLTADAPCSVLVRQRRDGTAVVCVSDPTRTLATLTVTWRHPVTSVLSRPGTVERAVPGRDLTLTFGDLTAEAGATQKVTVRTA
ncbi:hypothetical protein SHO565_29910 [Streptomyces sp. HO565]